MKNSLRHTLGDSDNRKYLLYQVMNRCCLLRSTKVRVNKSRVTVPIIRGVGIENIFPSEEWMTVLMQKLSQSKKGAFIDIGVNLGQTLIKYKSLAISEPYYGFEPNPNCCTYVHELIRKNRYGNVHIFPVGVSDNTGVTLLHINNDADSSGSMIENFRAPSYYSDSIQVLTVNGDELLQKIRLESVSIIKIDVEGAELEVLKGLARTISRYKPYIICEILPVYDENAESGKFRARRQREIERLIAENDYVMYRIHEDGETVALKEFGIHSDLRLTNYLFVHRDDMGPGFSGLSGGGEG